MNEIASEPRHTCQMAYFSMEFALWEDSQHLNMLWKCEFKDSNVFNLIFQGSMT